MEWTGPNQPLDAVMRVVDPPDGFKGTTPWPRLPVIYDPAMDRDQDGEITEMERLRMTAAVHATPPDGPVMLDQEQYHHAVRLGDPWPLDYYRQVLDMAVAMGGDRRFGLFGWPVRPPDYRDRVTSGSGALFPACYLDDRTDGELAGSVDWCLQLLASTMEVARVDQLVVPLVRRGLNGTERPVPFDTWERLLSGIAGLAPDGVAYWAKHRSPWHGYHDARHLEIMGQVLGEATPDPSGEDRWLWWKLTPKSITATGRPGVPAVGNDQLKVTRPTWGTIRAVQFKYWDTAAAADDGPGTDLGLMRQELTGLGMELRKSSPWPGWTSYGATGVFPDAATQLSAYRSIVDLARMRFQPQPDPGMDEYLAGLVEL